MRFVNSFARLLEFIQVNRIPRSRRRHAPRFPTACERCEERLLLSAPTITNNTASSVTEGSFPNISGTISDDGFGMVSVRMSTDGGVTWNGPQEVSPSSGSFSFMSNAMDDGTVNYILEATDTDSQVSTASGTITITNAVPVLSITSSPPSTIYDNQFLMSAISGSISDPGMSDTETLTVAWGDGTIENLSYGPNGTFSLGHAYGPIAGPTITITVSVADDDGGASSTFSYTLTEVPAPGSAPPTITLTTGSTAPEGSVAFTGSIADDISDPVSLRLSIDGGLNWESAGTVTPGNTFSISSMTTMTFDDGTVSYVVEATDANGNVVMDSGAVTVTNVAPTLSIPSPPSGTIHDNQSVTVSGTVSDPAGALDPLTVTINWGPGPNAIEVINIDPNSGGSFSASHAYALPSDQSITITVTVDDGDGGPDSESFSLTYDDVISGLDGEGHGAVGGSLHFLLSAHTDLGTISSYDVDIDHDGSYDVHMNVDADTWDPENVAILEAASLSLLGDPTSDSSFTGRFMVTTTGGFFDIKDMPITVTVLNAAAGGPTPDAPGAGAITDNVNSTTTITYDATFTQDQFKVLGRNPMGIPVSKTAAGGTVSLSADEIRNNFNQGIGGILWYGLDFRASLLANPAPGVAAMPYFVQYARNETTTTNPTTGNPTTVTTHAWGLDAPSNADANHPNMYGWQTIGNSTAAMSDQPGMALPVKIQPRRAGNNVELRMVRTIANELAQNPLHQQAWAVMEKRAWTFETYVVKRDVTTGALTSLGYLQWKFEVTATATGFTVGWGYAPIWSGGSGSQWNL